MNGQRCNSMRSTVVLAAVLSVTAAAGHAQVAEVAVGATEVVWRPLIDHEGLALEVSGPDGTVVRREAGGGEDVSHGVFDEKGMQRPDGTYVWELRATPVLSKDARERLEAARASGDDRLVAETIQALRAEGALPAEGSLVQTGSFTIQGGTVVPAGLAEGEGGAGPKRRAPQASRPTPATGTGPTPVSAADGVIPDDLIVQGSLCAGLDCINNESFGFDTIRLNENNLRIHFDDTSTQASFPANDWRLIANDSASGGASKLSIEDSTGGRTPFTITARAANNSIFVDSTGRVGFRTATPVLDLHAHTSNTPAIRLQQDSAGGFTAQTWDIGANEANFFVRDTTGGSRLSFRIRPGAPTSSIDVGPNGLVAFGHGVPEVRLDARGSTAAQSSLALTAISATDAPQAMLRRARPAAGSAAASRQGDVLGTVAFGGHDGVGFTTGASVSAFAEQLWSTGSTGTTLVLATAFNDTAVATPCLTVRHHGAVGIGTTSPRERLHVDGGNIMVSGGSFIDDGTELNVPDYVFEPGYELMPIAALAEFLARERHLPNVPDREEVAARGLDLGQFQMRLLEKVEELALYAIQQHGALQAVRDENAALRARLAAVEKAVAAP
jgi:hypothetical protein